MEKSNPKQINFYISNYKLGALYDKDEQGQYTYKSNIVGEIKANEKLFLPPLYEQELMGSVNKKSEEMFDYVKSITDRLTRADIVKSLGIKQDDDEFMQLYKLSSQARYIGEGISFVAEEDEILQPNDDGPSQ